MTEQVAVQQATGSVSRQVVERPGACVREGRSVFAVEDLDRALGVSPTGGVAMTLERVGGEGVAGGRHPRGVGAAFVAHGRPVERHARDEVLDDGDPRLERDLGDGLGHAEGEREAVEVAQQAGLAVGGGHLGVALWVARDADDERDLGGPTGSIPRSCSA